MATPRNLRRTPEWCMIPKNNFLFGIYGKKPLFKPFLHDSQPVFYLGFMGKRSMNPMSPINSVSASMNPMKSEAGIYAETHCLCGFSPCVPNNLLCVGRLIINPKGSLWQEKNIYTKFDEQHMAKWFCAKASVDLSWIMRNNFLQKIDIFRNTW